MNKKNEKYKMYIIIKQECRKYVKINNIISENKNIYTTLNK